MSMTSRSPPELSHTDAPQTSEQPSTQNPSITPFDRPLDLLEINTGLVLPRRQGDILFGHALNSAPSLQVLPYPPRDSPLQPYQPLENMVHSYPPETKSFSDFLSTGNNKNFQSENTANDKVEDSRAVSNNGFHQLDSGWTNSVTTASALEEDLISELSIRVPFSPNKGLFKLLLEAATQVYQELDKLEDSGFALGLDILPRQTDLFDEDDRSHFTGMSPADISLAHLYKVYERRSGCNMKRHGRWTRRSFGMLFQILRNIFHRSRLSHLTWGLLASG
jgi:hypothetical protein